MMVVIWKPRTLFRRFAHRKHSQSDARMNLAFFKFEGIIGWTNIAFGIIFEELIFLKRTFANTLFCKKLKNVSCEYNRLIGWNSTLQAAWYIRRVRIVWFLWTKPTIWLLILSFAQNIVRACSMFYPYEGYESVTPLDVARVNRTIFHNHSVQILYNPHKG